MLYDIKPCPKPRMTQRDKWLRPPRPAVARYWAFCDLVRAMGMSIPPSGSKITFYIKMPKGWGIARKKSNLYQPHQQKPDLSNLLKALEDAIFEDDSAIWHYSALEKLWAERDGISITINQP